MTFKNLQFNSISGYENKITCQQLIVPVGEMLAAATDDGICLLEFVNRKNLKLQLNSLQKSLKANFQIASHPLLDQLQLQLKAYFDGKLRQFDLPLLMPGTAFQQQVWQALQSIPYGETRSYQQQAERLGKKSAVRAVASANARNRLAIIVPCHRVIAKNGSLTGYAGGLDRKQYLLELEAG